MYNLKFHYFYKYSRDILIEMFYISVAYIMKDCYEFLDLIEKVIIRAREMVQWLGALIALLG